MSEKMIDENNELTWFEGVELGDNVQSIITSDKIFVNEFGEMALSVTGPEQVVHQYIENLKFAFTIEESKPVEYSEKPEQQSVASESNRTKLQIGFQFLNINYERPFQWKVYIDPFNVKINGLSYPHEYACYEAETMTATIKRDDGILLMRSGNQSVVVNAANTQNFIVRSSDTAQNFYIVVDGLDDVNQYDLYISGTVANREF